ncbi:MAG: signal peptidase II [Candidatus Neptunochlamydia sp.]|nr:signal peptidase II [Candidatus Neptunochlamydia sp.]
MWILVFSAVVFFIIDAASKYWVEEHLIHIQYATPFYPFGGIGVFQNVLGIDFAINKASNTGGAWSLFSTLPKTLLVVRIAIILSLLSYAFFFNRDRKRDLPFMLIITGALANIVDTFVYGSVVDMFHFILWGYSFPIFNVADILIFFGVTIMIFQELLKKIGSHAAHPSRS